MCIQMYIYMYNVTGDAAAACDYNDGNACCARNATCHGDSQGAPACTCPPEHTLINRGQHCILTSANPSCTDSQFTCSNGTCIPW